MNKFIQLFLSLTLAAALFGGVAVPVYADDDVFGSIDLNVVGNNSGFRCWFAHCIDSEMERG